MADKDMKFDPSIELRITANTERYSGAAYAPESEPDHHRNIPVPSEDCLYGIIGEIAKAGAENSEANPYAIALNAITYVAAMLGRSIFLPIGDSNHYPCIFAVHSGRTALGRKGDAMALIRKIDKSISNKKAIGIPYSSAPKLHSGGLSSAEGLIDLIKDDSDGGEAGTSPGVRDKRLLVVETELANILKKMQQQGNTLSPTIRNLWDGRSVQPATKNNKISTTDPHVCILGAITPAELLALSREGDYTNGFLNRFIIIFAERDRLVPEPMPVAQQKVDYFATQLEEICNKWKGFNPDNNDTVVMTTSAKARLRYNDLYLGELNKPPHGNMISSLLERRAPYVQRLAMIFAATDMTTTIELKHINAAWAWIRYWSDSVSFVFQTGAQEEQAKECTDRANRILEFVAQLTEVTRTKIVSLFNNNASKEQIDGAIDELLHSTPPKIVVESRATRGNQKPTRFYRLAANLTK